MNQIDQYAAGYNSRVDDDTIAKLKTRTQTITHLLKVALNT